MLKLQDKYNEVYDKIVENRTKIIEIGRHHKQHKNYNDFEIYFSAVIRDSLYSLSTICEWYDDYQCHDSHIISLFKSGLKNAGIFTEIA